MNRRAKNRTDGMTLGDFYAPSLEKAIENWSIARRAVEDEPCMEHRNGYEVANNKLGQAISRWSVERPELVEQFRFWFAAHPDY